MKYGTYMTVNMMNLRSFQKKGGRDCQHASKCGMLDRRRKLQTTD